MPPVPPPLPEFGRSVNPTQTRGGQIKPLTLLPAPPRIQKAIYTSVVRKYAKRKYL